MKTIKFKAKVVGSGGTIYGDLIHYRSSICIRGCLEEGDKDSFGTWEVEPKTVSQLVGYDCRGHEIYEGDTLMFEDKEYEVPYYEQPRFYSFSEVKNEKN